MAPDRIDMIERDVQSHAKTLSEITVKLIDIDKADAVRANDAKHLDSRLSRIEASIAGVYSLGKWILATAGTLLVAMVVQFTVNGGWAIG